MFRNRLCCNILFHLIPLNVVNDKNARQVLRQLLQLHCFVIQNILGFHQRDLEAYFTESTKFSIKH